MPTTRPRRWTLTEIAREVGVSSGTVNRYAETRLIKPRFDSRRRRIYLACHVQQLRVILRKVGR